MSHWGFSISPDTIIWERVSSCACMIICTWKFVITGQKHVYPPHQLSDWFPQTDIFGVTHKVTHVGHCSLQQKKKDQQCNAHEWAVAPKYLGETLAATPYMERCWWSCLGHAV